MLDIGEMLVLVPAFERGKHGEVQWRASYKGDDQQTGRQPPHAPLRVLARIARRDLVQGRPLQKACPIVSSLASSRSVQSQFEHAQYSVPFS